MSLFSKLFGGKSGDGNKSKTVPEDYKGFVIFPEPTPDQGGFRIGALIEKEIGGELKSHRMIRADTVPTEDDAKRISLLKAQAFIDQMGDGVFG